MMKNALQKEINSQIEQDYQQLSATKNLPESVWSQIFLFLPIYDRVVGMSAVSRALKRLISRNIHEVKLRPKNENSKHMIILMNSLIKSLAHGRLSEVTSIDLSDCNVFHYNIYFCCNRCGGAISAITKYCYKIKELNLGRCRLTDKIFEHRGEKLS